MPGNKRMSINRRDEAEDESMEMEQTMPEDAKYMASFNAKIIRIESTLD